MKSGLQPPDSHHLRAAIGWLELGNHTEAGTEISRIAAENLDHPDVLEIRWSVCAAGQSWEAGRAVAEKLIEHAPERASGWIHRAYSVRRARDGGLQKAWDALRPAFERFPEEPVIPYNLACYAALFDRMEEAWDWLQKAVVSSRDKRTIKNMALADPDLAALKTRVEKEL
jgi:Flp pilus assembly protein TadD